MRGGEEEQATLMRHVRPVTTPRLAQTDDHTAFVFLLDLILDVLGLVRRNKGV